MMRLLFPILFPDCRLLRVLIYARYSSEEQHPSSIQDQIDFCKKFLHDAGITDVQMEIEVIYDQEMSGELVSRPGINNVLEGILAKKWDIIIVEDSSRLFRHETACGTLIENAVDRSIRVLCINDDVDTADEDWEDRLHEAMRHHARSNKYLAKRIKRRHEGLWRMGAAIGLLRPGYKRRPTKPASAEGPAEGPFFDEIDPDWAPVVDEAFARIAKGEPPWLVGQWLTAQRLPKTANSLTQDWSDRNVISMIRETKYRGLERYRDTVARKVYGSGKHIPVPNDPEKVLTREMPHLRIVSDPRWHEANKAIDERRLGGPNAKGDDHPLKGIPRDSRGPLSELFFCGICGGKMYQEGRNEGGYRCHNAHLGGCWNKATAVRNLVHEEIGKAVVAQLLAVNGCVDGTLEYVKGMLQSDEPRQAQLKALTLQVAQRKLECDRLVAAIEIAKDPIAVVVDKLKQRNRELEEAKAQLEQLELQSGQTFSLPTKEQILESMKEMSAKILAMDRETGALLRQMVPSIKAVPYQQFGSNLVVLRANFDLHLATFFPERILTYLRGIHDGPLAQHFKVVSLSVDLFKRSAGPRLFKEALASEKDGLTLDDIGEKLGVARRQAHIAVMYGRAMAQAGLTDPFIELSSPPANASRWVLADKFLTKTAAPDPANDAAAPSPPEPPPDAPNR